MILATLLGNAQDAGVPQAGCDCRNCRAAWVSRAYRRRAVALGLLDTAARQWFLIDATPDFPEQLHEMQAMAEGRMCAGILITHAHMGHYTGLIHLGFEAMGVHDMPVYGTRRFLDFLQANGPWRQLLDQGAILPREITPDEWLTLTPDLAVKPLPVPHRAEWSDTLACIVRGPSRQLLYLPDIDGWDQWSRPIRNVVETVDVALLDGSFFDAHELPGRDLSEIGHPLATDTAERLAGIKKDVRLIHLNHSNPLHRLGTERDWLEGQGLRVAEEGDEWEL